MHLIYPKNRTHSFLSVKRYWNGHGATKWQVDAIQMVFFPMRRQCEWLNVNQTAYTIAHTSKTNSILFCKSVLFCSYFQLVSWGHLHLHKMKTEPLLADYSAAKEHRYMWKGYDICCAIKCMNWNAFYNVFFSVFTYIWCNTQWYCTLQFIHSMIYTYRAAAENKLHHHPFWIEFIL